MKAEAAVILKSTEDARKQLLKLVAAACAKHNGPVVILIDALDEADPPEQHRPGFHPEMSHIEPVGNKAVHLLLAQLVPKLPTNVRFVFSARPDTLLGTFEPVLGRAFQGGVFYLQPHLLRSGSGDSGRGEKSKLLYKM
jgi:hypothetical protein